MEITFGDEKVRELCEKRAVAVRKLGDLCARKLRTRLSELEAACTVADLSFGRPHALRGDREGEYAVDLHGGYRLTFSPGNSPRPLREDGSVDWPSVTIICIEFIGDYHD